VLVTLFSLNLFLNTHCRWVFSTLQPEDQRKNRVINRVYDTTSSSATKLKDHTWKISYGDRSGANGQVYLDRVGVGNFSVDKQAVQAASSVSKAFSDDAHNDGLLGLAFSKLNTIKPTKQQTWFDNVRPQLAAPVFTSSLKRQAVGTYDFGYIDKAKYRGNIVYTNVTGNDGFWNFDLTGFSVGNGAVIPMKINAIADTGSSLWYLPKQVADSYWAKVPGATYSTTIGQWLFPCTSKLPDMSIIVSGQKVTVPGIK
jgi:aspergillopepsin I